MYSNYYSEDWITKILRNVDIFCTKLPGILQNTAIFMVATVTASKFVLQKYFLSYYSNYNCWVLSSYCKIFNSSTIFYHHLFFANIFKRDFSNLRNTVIAIVCVVTETKVDKSFTMVNGDKTINLFSNVTWFNMFCFLPFFFIFFYIYSMCSNIWSEDILICTVDLFCRVDLFFYYIILLYYNTLIQANCIVILFFFLPILGLFFSDQKIIE
jgi:hypothetical protein